MLFLAAINLAMIPSENKNGGNGYEKLFGKSMVQLEEDVGFLDH